MTLGRNKLGGEKLLRMDKKKETPTVEGIDVGFKIKGIVVIFEEEMREGYSHSSPEHLQLICNLNKTLFHAQNLKKVRMQYKLPTLWNN